MAQHTIKYERSTLTGNWCSICSCGWMHVESKANDIIKRAEAHAQGKDWVAADPFLAREEALS